MPKIKSGEVISWKEFFVRWKSGIGQVSPFNQTKITFYSNWIIIFGIVAGLVITAFNWKTLWWLCIILLGALGNTLVLQYGTWQRYKILKKIELTLKPDKEIKGGIPNYV